MLKGLKSLFYIYIGSFCRLIAIVSVPQTEPIFISKAYAEEQNQPVNKRPSENKAIFPNEAIEEVFVQPFSGEGDSSLYFVDDALHPNAAIMAAIIAGKFDSNWQESEPNFLEKKFKIALQSYRKSWGALPQNILFSRSILKIGDNGPSVLALQNRLGGTKTDYFDTLLGDKIMQYRAAHNLPAGRHADKKLIDSLNLGFTHYHNIIAVNLHRAQELPRDLGAKYIWVNAANQTLYMIENDIIVDQMRVIVGSPENPTPMLAAFIRYSVINPYWNIPDDLTRDRYAPRALAQGPQYLKDRNFEILSGWENDAKILSYDDVNWQAVITGHEKLRMRQRPGLGNGMGDIKFMFPNRFGVYLHDTHNEASFLSSRRAISAGCVRVQHPWRLARWLYGQKPEADYNMPSQIVNLNEKIPVYITYFTAMPDDNGFSFYDDIYERDARLMEILNL